MKAPVKLEAINKNKYRQHIFGLLLSLADIIQITYQKEAPWHYMSIRGLAENTDHELLCIYPNLNFFFSMPRFLV